MHGPSFLASAFPKQLEAPPFVPPSNLSLAFWRQAASTGRPPFAALLWHFKSPACFLFTHLFLLARHLFCALAVVALNATVAASTAAPNRATNRNVLMTAPPWFVCGCLIRRPASSPGGPPK